MTADLSALIARLEAAKVGSRELDKAVAVACGSTIQVWAETASDGTFLGSVRPVTTSLDAAAALASRLELHADRLLFEVLEAGEFKSDRLALALVIATLRAKQGEG